MDQHAFRSSVLRNLQPEWASLARFSRSQGMPYLLNLPMLATSPAFQQCNTAVLLLDTSAPTALERTDGDWRAAAPIVAQPLTASVADVSSAFTTLVWPSRNAASTRAKNWTMWATAVTWGIARSSAHLLFPMSTPTLQALTMDLMGMRTPRSVIIAVWSAIQNRHRGAGLTPPIRGPNEFSTWTRLLGSLQGAPRPLLFPIHQSMVRRLLAWRPTALADNRDRLATCLATICCLRVSELRALRVCHLLFDFHCAYGIPGYEGTLALHIVKRKNDAQRRGHYPAVGRASNPDLDLVHQLRVWLRVLDIARSPLCSSRAGVQCHSCAPLFPRLAPGTNPTYSAASLPMSGPMVRDAVRRMAALCQGNPRNFSGISARKGGLTTAISAGVPEEIVFLQSGHGHHGAARAYMHLQDPALLFATFQAFRL
jgi:integrase